MWTPQSGCPWDSGPLAKRHQCSVEGWPPLPLCPVHWCHTCFTQGRNATKTHPLTGSASATGDTNKIFMHSQGMFLVNEKPPTTNMLTIPSHRSPCQKSNMKSFYQFLSSTDILLNYQKGCPCPHGKHRSCMLSPALLRLTESHFAPHTTA